ncbi:unnamed protein product [marine sediment metagenome]|uniref:Uncharacterized protein n=1 Tax=marine sediment metagenome TaxID=412755 RepID=X0SUU9_9ZZZZ
MQKNKPRVLLREKFTGEYAAVMMGKKLPSKGKPSSKLASELRRVQNIKSGQLSATGEKSVTAKLTMVLEAFNKCAKATNLNIDSIAISDKTINVVGSTSSRTHTRTLRKAIEANGLKILQDRLELKANRDNFTITLAPTK